MSSPLPLEDALKSLSACVMLLHLGKLIQKGAVNEATNIEKLADLLNAKLANLNLPPQDQNEVITIITSLKGLGLFKRETKPWKMFRT